MATLNEMLEEQARIKAELQRMEGDETVTEETDGNYRDTLVARWKELDEGTKPIIRRMEEIRQITRTAGDEANLERPAGQENGEARRYGKDSPDLVVRTKRDPYDDLQAVRSRLVTRSELKARALDAIEHEASRANLAHDFAEHATVRAQDNPGIARHILLTGSEEYQEAFRAYVEDPEENAQRAALSLTNANGGYLLPFVLDQVPVA